MVYLFTSESVAAGHPDKLCDNISDAILDACLGIEKNARVAIETMVKGTDKKSFIIVGGEITLPPDAKIDYEKIVRDTAVSIGYVDHAVGMNANDRDACEVIIIVTQQSSEISQGVDEGYGLHIEQGAGDQGLMFGFATDESEEYHSLKGTYMPLPAILSHRLTLEMTKAMKTGQLSWARPDSKSQVTVAYDENGTPVSIDTIVVAIQHDDLAESKFEGDLEKEWEFIKSEVEEKIIAKVIPSELINSETKVIVNGTGRFVKGGPHADAGLTGRKIIVDTYGGMGRHGGGAFSGKDPSKVDRSAAYAARWAAKHVVASGLAKKCEIQLAYAIGIAEPVSMNVNTMETGVLSDDKITKIVKRVFDFRPAAIIEKLRLRNPIYSKTASGGHFGREYDDKGHFSWELIDSEICSKLKEERGNNI
jgi:S-adenosylmethionine synthetase